MLGARQSTIAHGVQPASVSLRRLLQEGSELVVSHVLGSRNTSSASRLGSFKDNILQFYNMHYTSTRRMLVVAFTGPRLENNAAQIPL